MAITNTWLKSNYQKAREKAHVESDRDGLSARLSPRGKVTWQLRYRYGGKSSRLDLGTYPAVSLKSARDEALRLRGQLEKGVDPKAFLKREKEAAAGALTIRSLFDQWYVKYCKKRKVSHGEIKRSFELHVFPEFGNQPADQVSLQQWLGILEPLAATTPAIAGRILSNSKQMLKWGVKRTLFKHNVLSMMTASEDLAITKKKRKRSLSDDEIFQFWEALELSRMSTKNKLFLKLCLVFGCRNGELRKSEKADFDLKNLKWTVPAENHKLGGKSGEPLIRPIIKELVPLIEQAKSLSNSRYLIPCEGENRPMTSSASLSLPYNLRQWLRSNRDIHMNHWSIHDLRKTARTNWSELTEPHIAEIMLGHRLPGEWQVYDHHTYLKEQAEAYSAWWKRLMGLTVRREQTAVPRQ